MASPRPARWLAPLALLGTIGAVALVITASGGGSATDAGAGSPSVTGSGSTTASTTSRRPTTPRTYVVKAGDTLSAIAVSTGVSLVRIQRLNPGLDAQTLNTGQKIKLRP